jgi:archaemetzincin
MLKFPFKYLVSGMICFFISCGNDNAVLPKEHHTVYIQPMGNVNSLTIMHLQKQLSEYFQAVVINRRIEPPEFAFYPARNRYRADSLIKYLNKQVKEGDRIIGIVSFDISTTKEDNKDWGVIGLGFTPGKACIVSTYRLSKQKISDQLFKVAIHELGHKQGLPHCPVTTCYMRDAEGGNPTDMETGFCNSCKSFLSRRGWRFH